MATAAVNANPVNLRVLNNNGKAEIHVQPGQEVSVVADLPADGKGGPTDQNKTTAAGNNATVPLDNSAPAAGGPTESVPGEKLDDTHRKWASVGDPHIRMGNENFDNMQRGDFTLMQSKDKSFQVQARQEAPPGAPNVTVNTAAAVKDGDNVVSYDVKTKKLQVNGAEWDGKTQPAGGTKIEKTGDGYSVTSSKGDVTNIHDKGNYLDLDGELGPDRTAGEVAGAHGVFDNTDGTESHVKRDGTKAANRDEMINDWRVKPEEDLFAAAGKGGPDGKGGPGQIDDETKKMLTDMMTQLTDLTKNLTALIEKLGIQPQPAPAADGKGGPAAEAPAAAAPAAAAPAAAAPAKTFEEQKKDDVAKAAGADGKGGPAAAEAPAAANDIFGDIMKALQGLMEMLTKLMAQLQGGAAPAAAPVAAAADAAKAA